MTRSKMVLMILTIALLIVPGIAKAVDDANLPVSLDVEVAIDKPATASADKPVAPAEQPAATADKPAATTADKPVVAAKPPIPVRPKPPTAAELAAILQKRSDAMDKRSDEMQKKAEELKAKGNDNAATRLEKVALPYVN